MDLWELAAEADSQLTIVDVDVRLSGKAVLNDLHLTIPHGVTALVGRNGSGKTSLMRVLTGALKPERGEVRRHGQNIFATSRAMTDHRKTLGWLPQEPSFPPRMTITSLLLYSAWLKKLPASLRESAVATALTQVDLTEIQHTRLGRLSGGQRRRAALAAALVGQPEVLLLDEPTNGLDPAQRERFLTNVRQFSVTRTVLLATHLLEDVGLAADQWVALESGRFVKTGQIDRSSTGHTAESISDVRAALSYQEGVA